MLLPSERERVGGARIAAGTFGPRGNAELGKNWRVGRESQLLECFVILPTEDWNILM